MATPDNTTTLPSPPFYTHIPNINNLRLATHSLTTQSGATLRPNLLFRSAEVSKVDAAGWTALRQLGVGHVFDLRSKPEIDKDHSNNDNNNNNNNNSNSKDDANADAVVGSKAGGEGSMQEAGVQRTWVPVFEESDYSPERLAERYAKYMDQDVRGFVEAYSEFLKSGGNAYGVILRYLANLSASAPGQEEGEEEGVRRPRGALIHCTAGKDRTGMFFGLLFDFLGVPRDQIATEYHLTQRGLSGVREQVVARLLASPAFTKYMTAQASGTPISPGDIAKALHDDAARGSSAGSDGDKQIPQEILDKGREAALRMVSARKESMLGALEMLDRQFGGAERYMREVCGLGDGELEGLRRNLLVGYGRGA